MYNKLFYGANISGKFFNSFYKNLSDSYKHLFRSNLIFGGKVRKHGKVGKT